MASHSFSRVALRSTRSAPALALLIASVCLSSLLQAGERPYRLDVEIVPRFAGAPLSFDTLTNTTASGQRVSVTRLDFLVSNWALRRSDGSWISLPDAFAYVSGREKRTRFGTDHAPIGAYDRLRFHVGLTPELNHSRSAQYASDHPLNPNVNGLHWGWSGGYVFFAMEGHWRESTDRGSERGYSFHLATDRQLMTVELPIQIELPVHDEIRVALNVDRIFGDRESPLHEGTSSTHSREQDAVADQIRRRVEEAFAVDSVLAGSARSMAGRREAPETATEATPYRFEFSEIFPVPSLPLDNPLTEEGVELGRRLFLEPRLSANNSQSCASCHQSSAAFVDPAKAVSAGVDGKNGTRNAMPLFNLAWKSSFFWDGRAPALRQQVLQPIENPIEMHETLANVVGKLSNRADGLVPIAPARELSGGVKSTLDFPELFDRAFGTRQITPDRMARALEQFLLTIVSDDSKFDRVLNGRAAFTQEEQRGFELFHTEYDPRRGQFGADCFHCHGGPLFRSQNFANNGLETTATDLGRYLVTGQEGDRGKFAVPSLRNVELTAPYMHDGRFRTLEEVIDHYSAGVKFSATLDPNLAKHPEGGVPLSQTDKRALAAFLRTLTDPRFLLANRRSQADP